MSDIAINKREILPEHHTSCSIRHSAYVVMGSGKDCALPQHEALSLDNARNNTDTSSPQQSSHVVKLSAFLLLGGIILGTISPQNPALPSASWRLLSSIIGYTYFLSWSASFYPQIMMNYERKTTRGLSVDFCVLNVLGYCCYTVYTTTLFWNQHIREEYKHRFSSDEGESAEITVQANDVAFALHAIVMSSITLSQIGFYDTFTSRPPSKRVIVIISSTIVFCIGYLCFTFLIQGSIDYLGFLYLLGMIKLGVTIGKYVPQALLNKARQSTVGWNVLNVILDLIGGLLSLLQLVGDCASMRDWSGIVGNPVKLCLSLITIVFDLIFLIQHYVLYPDKTTYSSLPINDTHSHTEAT